MIEKLICLNNELIMVFHNNLLWWSTVRDLFLGGALCRRLVDSFLSPRNPKSSLITISIYESTVKNYNLGKNG